MTFHIPNDDDVLPQPMPVTLHWKQQSFAGQVVLMSHNRKSISVTFDGMILGYLGMIPLLWDDERHAYFDLFYHQLVDVAWTNTPDAT